MELPKYFRRDPSCESLSENTGLETPMFETNGSPVCRTPDTTPPSSRPESPDFKSDAKDALGSSGSIGPTTPSAKNICFIGAGFVGGPTAALIAYHNPGITVNVVDLSTLRISAWNSEQLPIHEAGLDKIVRIVRDGTRRSTVVLPGCQEIVLPARTGNLVFSTGVTKHIKEADLVFLAVNTPTKIHGDGAGSNADLAALESATRTMARHLKEGAIVVEKSTVPCGTAGMISEILSDVRPETSFEVLSNPEFLAEGTAVNDLMHPDRILIGSAQTASGLQAAEVLKSVYLAWVPHERILTINTTSSELAKLVANFMLAQRISSINAMSALCESLGADVEQVARAVGADMRLGSRFLQAGIGFGGSCFEKDILNLASIAESVHHTPVTNYLKSVLDINQYQRNRFVQTVVRKMNGSLRGKKIAVLGFAFKSGTNDVRNSIAVHVIAQLVAERPSEIAIFDPGCAAADVEQEISAAITNMTERKLIKIVGTWRRCVSNSAAVCVLTQWPHFGATKPSTSRITIPTKDTVARASFQPRPIQPEADRPVESRSDLSEMEILELEKLVPGDLANQPRSDSLGRMIPLPPGAEEGNAWERKLVVQDGDDVVDWDAVAQLMAEGSRWVFDGRNVVDVPLLKSLGFKVHSIGKAALR